MKKDNEPLFGGMISKSIYHAALTELKQAGWDETEELAIQLAEIVETLDKTAQLQDNVMSAVWEVMRRETVGHRLNRTRNLVIKLLSHHGMMFHIDVPSDGGPPDFILVDFEDMKAIDFNTAEPYEIPKKLQGHFARIVEMWRKEAEQDGASETPQGPGNVSGEDGEREGQ